MHLAAALPNVKWIEYFLADNPLHDFQTRLWKGPLLHEVRDEDQGGIYLRSTRRARPRPGAECSLRPSLPASVRRRWVYLTVSDHAGSAQVGNLLGGFADLGQDGLGVLADAATGPAHAARACPASETARFAS